jgi:pimeloyl-ACP methyl ester carboxylesterase
MRAASFVARSLCAVLMVGAMAGHAHAQQEAVPVAAPSQRGANQAVYLIKGLAGFQTGVDVLGEKLLRRGIVPRFGTHGGSDSTADEIIKRYKGGLRAPVILVGYSLGADAAGSIARRLHAHRISVALLVIFGPVADVPVTPNVARAINYYQSTSAWRGRMIPAAGFRGSLRNLNLDNEPGINHFTIVSADRYQLQTIANISALVGGSRKPAQPKPTDQAAAGEAKAPTETQSKSEPAPARSN